MNQQQLFKYHYWAITAPYSLNDRIKIQTINTNLKSAETAAIIQAEGHHNLQPGKYKLNLEIIEPINN